MPLLYGVRVPANRMEIPDDLPIEPVDPSTYHITVLYIGDVRLPLDVLKYVDVKIREARCFHNHDIRPC